MGAADGSAGRGAQSRTQAEPTRFGEYPRFALNGRFATRTQPTGVDQVAREVARRIPDAVVIPSVRHTALTNLWEQFVLPVRVGTSPLLSLANSGPALARHHVVAIHDTAHWDHPEWFGSAYRTKVRTLNRAWARTAAHLVCPSETVAANIERWLRRPRDEITVIGNGHRWGSSLPSADRTRQPFVLAVGTSSTRKNLDTLIRAWGLVRAQRPDLTLRLAGATGGAVFGGSGRVERDEGVEPLGFVTDEQLDRLYLDAAAVVAPSRYEGFDLPALDAICAGTPVVASDIDVHRELYDGFCPLVDPDDHVAFASNILASVGSTVDDRARRELARRHSWDHVTQRVLGAVSRCV